MRRVNALAPKKKSADKDPLYYIFHQEAIAHPENPLLREHTIHDVQRKRHPRLLQKQIPFPLTTTVAM